MMKIPKATQLPSGSWRVRVRVNDQYISITRSTEKAALAEAMALKANEQKVKREVANEMTLRDAINKYISLNRVALSPATIRGYCIIRDNRFHSVMDRTIKKTTDQMYQEAINEAVETLAEKTIYNSWSFCSTVLKDIAKRKVKCKLPTVVTEERDFLEPEQITVFIKAIKGHPKEIPILLALHGLRVSEVLDITWKDIDLQRKTITIHGSAVVNENNELIHKKTNKNSTSRRVIPILIPQLKEAVMQTNQKGVYVCTTKSGALYNAINRVCKKNDLPEIGTHGLRHSFASLCYYLKIPVEMTQKWGGWKTKYLLERIYTHLASRDMSNYAERVNEFFEDVQ